MITVAGADRLAGTLATAADQLEDLAGPNRAVASLVAGRVRPPVLTGALAASIHGTGTATEATVSSGLVYAPVHEYGWPARNIAGRHYMTAAIQSTTPAVISKYRDTVSGVISHVKGE